MRKIDQSPVNRVIGVVHPVFSYFIAIFIIFRRAGLRNSLRFLPFLPSLFLLTLQFLSQPVEVAFKEGKYQKISVTFLRINLPIYAGEK